MKRVSIVLPTFNRAHFLEQAFASLETQTFKDWHLIIVDDGSTDNTAETIECLTAKYNCSCEYIYQQNGGPAKARNTGISKATGDYLAFFDSDDTWDADYLATAISTLDSHADLDWVYFPCRRVDFFDGSIILPSTFYQNDKPNLLFSLVKERRDNLNILDNDKAAIGQLTQGIDSGLQNSVMRAKVAKQIPIPDFRIGEDRLFILQALKAGFTLGFIDNVAVTYFVHDGNSSDTKLNDDNLPKRIAAMKSLINSYEKTPDFVSLNKSEMAALNERLAQDYFWKLGYALYAQNKHYSDALQCMVKAITFSPGKPKFYKTYLLTWLKRLLFAVAK